MSDYTDSMFFDELAIFMRSPLFTLLHTKLLDIYANELAAIPSSDVDRLVAQKRKIEALNDLIGTMRSFNADQTLEEVNAANRNQYA